MCADWKGCNFNRQRQQNKHTNSNWVAGINWRRDRRKARTPTRLLTSSRGRKWSRLVLMAANGNGGQQSRESYDNMHIVSRTLFQMVTYQRNNWFAFWFITRLQCRFRVKRHSRLRHKFRQTGWHQIESPWFPTSTQCLKDIPLLCGL